MLLLTLGGCGDDFDSAAVILGGDTLQVSDVGGKAPDSGQTTDTAPPDTTAPTDTDPDPDPDLGPPDSGAEDTGGADPGASDPGADAPALCPAGATGCVGPDRLVCNPQGTAFELWPCEDGLVCAGGACVECLSSVECEAGETCEAGTCLVPPLAIASTVLPTGLAGLPYAVQLAAVGGILPYTWASGDPATVAPGLTLSAGGLLAGAPAEAGTWDIAIVVTDDAGGTASATLTLDVAEGGMVITTPAALPPATEGEPYSIALAADGGTPPYFFGALDPPPLGLTLGSDGVLQGVPTEAGTSSFAVKAFDNGAPTLTAQRTFELEVGLAPLQIFGDQEVDLFITKLITLPLIVVVDSIPIPYNAQLQAKGGKKPYTWTELPISPLVAGLIPGAGLPDGLSLSEGGAVTGAVTDPSLVVSVEIPFTGIVLSGFFFSAEVADSQDPPEKKSALFIIPTVPIGGP